MAQAKVFGTRCKAHICFTLAGGFWLVFGLHVMRTVQRPATSRLSSVESTSDPLAWYGLLPFSYLNTTAELGPSEKLQPALQTGNGTTPPLARTTAGWAPSDSDRWHYTWLQHVIPLP